MNPSTVPNRKSSLDPSKLFRQQPAPLRASHLANSSLHSKADSRASIKPNPDSYNTVRNPNHQRMESSIKSPLMLQECFSTDLEELIREIDGCFRPRHKCASVKVRRRIFAFFELYFSNLDGFRKIIEVLFESVFDNSYAQFLSQLEYATQIVTLSIVMPS